MDSLQKWYAQMADVQTLFSHWEKQTQTTGFIRRKRSREILTICLFTLCLENNEDKRFLIGFQQRGEIEDVDVILVPDLGEDGPAIREIHRFQIVGYLERPNPSTEDLIEFLEEKKLRIAPNDDDLCLIIHLEQPIAFDWVPLSIHFQMRLPKCPYSQVFLLAQTSLDRQQPIYSCRQIYPLMLPLRDMDLQTARAVIADRKTVCRFVPNSGSLA
jgi:hypothetical protein